MKATTGKVCLLHDESDKWFPGRMEAGPFVGGGLIIRRPVSDLGV